MSPSCSSSLQKLTLPARSWSGGEEAEHFSPYSGLPTVLRGKIPETGKQASYSAMPRCKLKAFTVAVVLSKVIVNSSVCSVLSPLVT